MFIYRHYYSIQLSFHRYTLTLFSFGSFRFKIDCLLELKKCKHSKLKTHKNDVFEYKLPKLLTRTHIHTHTLLLCKEINVHNIANIVDTKFVKRFFFFFTFLKHLPKEYILKYGFFASCLKRKVHLIFHFAQEIKFSNLLCLNMTPLLQSIQY